MSAIARELEGILMSPLKQMFGFAEKRQVRKYEDLIDGEMMRILERRLGDDSLHDKKDICSLAIEEMKRDGGELTQEDKVSITHQLKTFYFAGHDTTATTISWAVWLLSQHPEALDKVRAELKGHCVWTTPDRAPSYEDLQKCVYLEATLKETLRLYPPAAGVSRFTADAGAEWNGYSLTGALLMLSIYCMGRHPLLWKEPEIFRPDRFLDGSEEPPQSKYSINAKFTAFSKGPRDCMGKYFALLEAKLAVAALVSRYDLECVDPKERLISLLTTLPKNGAMIKFHHRKAES
jgi:cytochrome P450